MGVADRRAGLESSTGFPSPFEVAVPPECVGWEELYPPHAVFSEDRRAFDEGRFWFQDAVHYAEPYCPFDALLPDCIVINFNQTSARRFVVPTSLGVEQRILGGYVYLSPNSITDETTIAARAELFATRGGYYYEHWAELDQQWRDTVQTRNPTARGARGSAAPRRRGRSAGHRECGFRLQPPPPRRL